MSAALPPSGWCRPRPPRRSPLKRTTLGAALVPAAGATLTPVLTSTVATASSSAPTSQGLQPLTPAQHAALVAWARSATSDIPASLGLTRDDAFTVRSVTKDRDGVTHTHVDRTYRGMKVVGGDLVVDRDASGRITRWWGPFSGRVTVGTTPTLSTAESRTRGLAASQAYKRTDGLRGAAVTGGTLVVFVARDGSQHLGYETLTTGTTDDRTPARVTTIVDADHGGTLLSHDQVADGTGISDGDVVLSTTQSGSTFTLANTDTGKCSTDAGNRKSDGTTPSPCGCSRCRTSATRRARRRRRDAPLTHQT